MVTVAITLAEYTIPVAHLINLAGEYSGDPTHADGSTSEKGSTRVIEFTFKGTSAPANARAFRKILDGGFQRKGRAADGAGAEAGREGDGV